MTENMQANRTQSREAVIARCCLKNKFKMNTLVFILIRYIRQNCIRNIIGRYISMLQLFVSDSRLLTRIIFAFKAIFKSLLP